MTVLDPEELVDVDAVLVTLILKLEAERPLTGAEVVAVRAIVALSLAGAALMTDASHAGSRDVERLSERARAQLDDARSLLTELRVSRS